MQSNEFRIFNVTDAEKMTEDGKKFLRQLVDLIETEMPEKYALMLDNAS